jgi:HK97 gp10 family phage protein
LPKLTNVKGLDELQLLLNQVPAKLEANVMRGALRAGMKEVLVEVRANVPVESGQLREGLKIGTKKKFSMVIATIKATGKHSFVAPFIEFGTARHAITGKDGRPLFFGGLFVGSVDHPGARAKPFMRPALDSKAGAALIATAEYIKNRLATKHGLDTSHIEIEGDE